VQIEEPVAKFHQKRHIAVSAPFSDTFVYIQLEQLFDFGQLCSLLFAVSSFLSNGLVLL
jgi:hypothetical protein